MPFFWFPLAFQLSFFFVFFFLHIILPFLSYFFFISFLLLSSDISSFLAILPSFLSSFLFPWVSFTPLVSIKTRSLSSFHMSHVLFAQNGTLTTPQPPHPPSSLFPFSPETINEAEVKLTGSDHLTDLSRRKELHLFPMAPKRNKRIVS